MKAEADRELLVEAQKRGTLSTLGVYARLSGPGWLQSAITLGGGSLASSLYLGVLAGFTMLWLQPIAMVFGIIMLSAISYVTLSTGERPFQAINRHVSPVLGWAWALAALVASIVWCLPQYSLATGVLQQNLLPEILGTTSALGDFYSKVLIAGVILVITTLITWSYDTGGWGVRLYETMLKVMVAMIVLCFVGVVLRMSFADGGLVWSDIFRGFIPDLTLFYKPTPGFEALLVDVPERWRHFWESRIVSEQRHVMISAAATAVGINMTFLLPYTLLKRGWTREFRGLLAFDLSTGMFIPFVMATSCVIIASATQFHPRLDADSATAAEVKVPENVVNGLLKEMDRSEPLTPAEMRLQDAMKRRDAGDLAHSLAPFTGTFFANFIFGLGVLGMTLSTITILMLISGLVICEIFNVPRTGWPYRIGTLAAATGALGPFVWSGARFYLAIPASVFGMALLPIAYITFFVLMNQKKLLGDDLPRGGRRVVWNVLMATAATVASFASAWVIYNDLTPLLGKFVLWLNG